ncbi:MAG: cysteine desulfurase [Candidatus Shapirobacteria bacterium]|nr:cysteine desulfurase [Candidatus Shapirobacteria bacterium]
MKNNFPIFQNNPDLVYLDSAATSLKPAPVILSEMEYYIKYSANIHRGLYQMSQIASDQYDQSRQIIADFINSQSNEIIFTSGTTASINLVAQTWGQQNIKSGDEIIITQMEHHSNLVPWQQLAKTKKAKLKYLPVTSDFLLDQKSLLKLITSKTKIVALAHVSNVLGTINPIKKIVQTIKKINPKTLVLVDGAQSVAHFPVDVVDLGVDFYAFSGHKLYGPTGIGVLYINQKIYSSMSPTSFGGGAIKEVFWHKTILGNPPFCYEPGTPPIAQAIALSQAIKFIQKIGWPKIIQQEQDLTNYLFQKLKTISDLKILGPTKSDQRLGVISFAFTKPKSPTPHDIGDILSQKFNIAVRTGFHCAMPLHQLFGFTTGTTRVSLGIYNTQKDIDKLIDALNHVIKIFS